MKMSDMFNRGNYYPTRTQEQIQPKIQNGNNLQKFWEFANNFKGDPKEVINNALATGKISPQDLENAKQQASNLLNILSK